MAATVRADYYGASGSEPAGTNADKNAGGAVAGYDLEDVLTGTASPVQLPTSTHGTNYSWYKLFALHVTATAGTAISNRKFSNSAGATTGLFVFFLDQATYTQPTSGNKPTDNAVTDGATPAGYTLATTSPVGWDATSHSAGSTGRNGDFVQVAVGVATTFAGGAGSATALPDHVLTYDEA